MKRRPRRVVQTLEKAFEAEVTHRDMKVLHATASAALRPIANTANLCIMFGTAPRDPVFEKLNNAFVEEYYSGEDYSWVGDVMSDSILKYGSLFFDQTATDTLTQAFNAVNAFVTAYDKM